MVLSTLGPNLPSLVDWTSPVSPHPHSNGTPGITRGAWLLCLYFLHRGRALVGNLVYPIGISTCGKCFCLSLFPSGRYAWPPVTLPFSIFLVEKESCVSRLTSRGTGPCGGGRAKDSGLVLEANKRVTESPTKLDIW